MSRGLKTYLYYRCLLDAGLRAVKLVYFVPYANTNDACDVIVTSHCLNEDT
jgi:hypothetical protein